MRNEAENTRVLMAYLVEVDLRLGVRHRDGRRRVAADRRGTEPGKSLLQHGAEHDDNGVGGGGK